jgi:hypothetical protein
LDDGTPDGEIDCSYLDEIVDYTKNYVANVGMYEYKPYEFIDSSLKGEPIFPITRKKVNDSKERDEYRLEYREK